VDALLSNRQYRAAGATFDLRADETRNSLEEVIAWCAGQRITATVEESEEVRRRRQMGERASELMSVAIRKQQGFWDRLLRRDYTKRREYRDAKELFRRADLASLPIPLSSQLRSPELSPPRKLEETRIDEERNALVRAVIERRRALVRTRPDLALRAVGDDLNGGRILVYAPDENVSDGASEVASSGFFDLEDAPPWDLWVAYGDGALFAWVPPALLTLAQRGIEVNVVDCIWWLR
jgi:hypothetical protein